MIRARAVHADVPRSLASPAVAAEVQRAQQFFAAPARKRAQQRFAFADVLVDDADVNAALSELFAGKCAYCEASFTLDRPLRVDRFRPFLNAVGLTGDVSSDHYWWLAYEWTNLLPACPECARLKGARFPVRKARAKPGTRGAQLEDEHPLLVNPRRDRPEKHLVYLNDGTVTGTTDRGRTTVEILGLNRSELVRARCEALARARAEWLALLERDPAPAAVEKLYDSVYEFAGMRRQFITTWAAEHDRQLADKTVAMTDEVEIVVTFAEQRKLKTAHESAERRQESFSVHAAEGTPGYFIRTRQVERIVVRNLRVIEDLDLTVTASTRYWAPWLMLLGENGTGKSSILQAVALALVGDAYRRRLKIDPASFLRHGAHHGWVEVYLSGAREPTRLEFTRTAFRSNQRTPKVLLLGYGATRLLPRPGARRHLAGRFSRVDNLFDPFWPLADATPWLLELPAEQFDTVARALKGILALGEDVKLRRNYRAGRVEVEAEHRRTPIGNLSDGHQSILAFALDIMSVMLHRWEAMEVAEGIALVDELGAHLHPRWRMSIVGALREVFPRVQFIASTHDPLCLRGLLDGEVAVLKKRPEGDVFKITDLPPVEGLRVDQLLTSEHFGLNSTIDPELDRVFSRYYELKGRWTLTPPERVELNELTAHLDGLHLLGRTRRERLMIEATDEYLAHEQSLAGETARRALRKETKKRIVDLWKQTEPAAGVAPPL